MDVQLVTNSWGSSEPSRSYISPYDLKRRNDKHKSPNWIVMENKKGRNLNFRITTRSEISIKDTYMKMLLKNAPEYKTWEEHINIVRKKTSTTPGLKPLTQFWQKMFLLRILL